jgi:hypothetical protein
LLVEELLRKAPRSQETTQTVKVAQRHQEFAEKPAVADPHELAFAALETWRRPDLAAALQQKGTIGRSGCREWRKENLSRRPLSQRRWRKLRAKTYRLR